MTDKEKGLSMQSASHFSQGRGVENEPLAVDPFFPALRRVIEQDLRPQLHDIDVNGVYPKAFMRRVGETGGFKQGTPTAFGGTGKGIKWTIQVIEEISRECLSTGFITWCQTVCAWYIQHGVSDYLKAHILPQIITGERLAGTGLSNPMKHFAGIEKIHLTAQHSATGYLLNGSLPWVSNVDLEHYFAVVARVVDEDAYLMCVVPGNLPGLALRNGGHFIALEGSSTYSCTFRDAFVPNDYILAYPCDTFIPHIQPGFMLTQTGFGLGLVDGCLELIKRTNNSKGHVNCFLNDQADILEADLHAAREYIYSLANEIGCGEQKVRPNILQDVVQARILASELSLRASQSAMLHAGASGYRLHSPFERKLRESYFVAIVTPALKHLKKIQHYLSQKQ
jgi:alkylation response protein AidB-like acyl-CoA dehydrogenase